jgi:RNA polymerase sigma-70 factor (ECF subfamily)
MRMMERTLPRKPRTERSDASDGEHTALAPPSLDLETVRGAARGDRQAFERVYDACLSRVWPFAVEREGRRKPAEELTSRILTRLFQRLESFDGRVTFGAWLAQVAAETGVDRSWDTKERARRREL